MRFSSFVLTVAGLTSAAGAQSTWYVDGANPPPGSGTQPDPYSSIQYAVDQPTTLSGDTILVAPGVYAEQLNYAGKSLAIESTKGHYLTTLQGSVFDAAPLVTVASGEAAGTRLVGFRLRSGNGQSVSGPKRGGAIVVVSSELEVRDCEFRENGPQGGIPVYEGGAIFASAATLSVVDCVFHGNIAADGNGGALSLLGGNTLIDGCGFAFNRLTTCPTNCGGGGAIWQGGNGTLTVEDSWFQENHAGKGGAIFLEAGAAQIRRCRFLLNTSDGGISEPPSGGALGLGALATASVSRSVFSGNDAHSSGPIAAAGGAVAGAVPGSLVMEHCVLSGNSLSGLVAANGGSAAQVVVLLNSVVWNNSTSAPAILGGPSTATYSIVQGAFPGTGNLDVNPLFWDESLSDFRLQAGSPCIDAGDPASPPDPDTTVADMGAFPFDASYAGGPVSYCTAKVNSLGCLPELADNGQLPSISGPPLVSYAHEMVSQQNGLLFWGPAQAGFSNFFGGFLCVTPPLQRTLIQNAGGVAGLCSGVYYFTWTSAYLADFGLGAGSSVACQVWARDPADPFTVSLSAGSFVTFYP
jgi:hypothetical protein